MLFRSVLPECAEQLGGGALLVAAAGLLGPALLRAQLGRDTALSLAGLGLGLHAAMDGAALLTPSLGPDPDRAALALAVVVHRFPMGLLVVGLAGGGRRGAALAVGGLTVATLVGMAVAPTLGVAAESPGLAVFQALVGGSLLHVLLDRSPLSALDGPPAPRVAQLAAEAVGFALGVASSFVLPAHDHALGHSPGESAALGVALLLAFGLRKTPRGWVLSRLARP